MIIKVKGYFLAMYSGGPGYDDAINSEKDRVLSPFLGFFQKQMVILGFRTITRGFIIKSF